MIRSCLESLRGDDQCVEESVWRQLFELHQFTQSEISFRVVRGEVILRGEVSSWYRKQLIQEAVLSMAEVQSVQNLITVKAR